MNNKETIEESRKKWYNTAVKQKELLEKNNKTIYDLELIIKILKQENSMLKIDNSQLKDNLNKSGWYDRDSNMFSKEEQY